MNSDFSWDEFRLVKSIADARSLVGAAERLGVNPSTVYRRLAAVEAVVGARLFDRSRAGYEPTAPGEDMIALAATMAASIVEFERRVAGRDVKPTGELCVTVPLGLGLHFMPAIVAQFQAANPGVVVELILSNEALDLSRRDADVAVRFTNDPPETLVGRRICTARFCLYRRCDTAAEAGSEAAGSIAIHRLWRLARTGVGPPLDRGQCRAGRNRRQGEFGPLHARAGASRGRRGVAAVFPRRSKPEPCPCRLSAAGT